MHVINIYGPVTEDSLNEMVAEVYMKLKVETKDLSGANVKIQVRNTSETSNSIKEEKSETRQRPQQSNSLLQDLIRILILREILNRPGGRPPFPGPVPPPRPPYPGPGPRPPFPGGRPTIW